VREYFKEAVTMYKQILIALDGSSTSERVLNEAVKMARLTGGKIQAVYVVDKTPLFSYAGYYDPIALVDALRKDGRTTLQKAEAACREAGVACDAELVETERLNEDVATALQHCAERLGADLVILGTHGRRGVRRIVLGSVAERFVRFAQCPVLLVRGTEPDHGEQG
jgi:nucleotide-binding universal stress UspA family protein